MSSDSDVFAHRSRDEVLERVYRRGRLLRARRLGLQAGTPALALVVVLGALVLPGDGSGTDEDVLAAGDGKAQVASDDIRPGRRSPGSESSGGSAASADGAGAAPSDSASEPSVGGSTDPASGGGSSGGQGDDGEPSGSAPGSSGSAPAGTECRNSTNPDCGDFYWDPEPGPNQPLEIDVLSVEDADGNEYMQGDGATVPEDTEVTFVVRFRDPDAEVSDEWNAEAAYGDGGHSTGAFVACSMAARFGPWTPPDPVTGEAVWEFTYTYEEVGSYTATFSYTESECGNPYASSGSRDLTVSVEEPGPKLPV